MQQDAYQKQEVAKYQDQLARQRMEAEHEKQRVRNIELVRLQVRAPVHSSLPPSLTNTEIEPGASNLSLRVSAQAISTPLRTRRALDRSQQAVLRSPWVAFITPQHSNAYFEGF
jgi:hypothetical protein